MRELLVTGKGSGICYAGRNLKGAYLKDADLEGADFTEAYMSGACLERANLTNANLSKTQALGTDFRNADLTGACLEAWNIDSTTVLEGAHADYVFLLGNNRERRPSSGTFRKGEFAKLFQEVLDTVDFIFENGIDWQAFMLSFDNMREKIRVECENADVSVQSIENKGDGVFVVRVNVPKTVDKTEVHENFTKEYDSNLKLLEEKYKMQLEFKDREIEIYKEKSIDFKEIIMTLASKPVNVIIDPENIDQSNEVNIGGNASDNTIIQGDSNKINQREFSQ